MDKTMYEDSEKLKQIIGIYKELNKFWKFDKKYERKQFKKIRKLIANLEAITKVQIDCSDQKVIDLVCNNKYKFECGIPIFGDSQIQEMINIIKPIEYEDLECLIKQLHNENYKTYIELAYKLAYYKLYFPLEFYCSFLNFNKNFIKKYYIFKKIGESYDINHRDTKYLIFYEAFDNNMWLVYSINIIFKELKKREIEITYKEKENTKEFELLDKIILLPKMLFANKVIVEKEKKLIKYKLKDLKTQYKCYNNIKE